MSRFFLILGILVLVSCAVTKKPPPEVKQEPLRENFLYYDESFSLPPNTPLRTDGLYFHLKEEDVFGDTHFIFRFYPDGVVLEYNVYNTPEMVMALERKTEGNLHGYYQIQGDTLLFSTAVYYDHQQHFYKARIYEDSIVVKEDRFTNYPGQGTTYYFFEQ